MIRISKKADYALFAMSHLARHTAKARREGDGSVSPVSAQEIANVSSLNKSVVANLLKDLARAGLLSSTRGVQGGYRLERDASSISLAEILAVVDGPVSIVDCAQALSSLRIESQQPGSKAAGDGASPADHGSNGEVHCCNLASLCPSKLPMQILNARVHHLLQDLRLDELSGLRAPSTPPFPQGRGRDRSFEQFPQPAGAPATR